MQTIELGALPRELSTGGAKRKMRESGRIPAVVYGGERPPAHVSLDAKELAKVLKGHGTNILVGLKVEGKTDVVLLKEIQRDVLSHKVIHLDFQRISMTKPIEVNVPLRLVGESPGVKVGGGILEHILRELRVRCLPADIPDHIGVDVSALQLNQGIKVKDVRLPERVAVLTEGDGLVANVVAPAAEEAPAAAAAPPTGAPEPEVIAKGKKPEEGEEGAAAPAPGKEAKAAAPAAGKEAKAASPGKEKK